MSEIESFFAPEEIDISELMVKGLRGPFVTPEERLHRIGLRPDVSELLLSGLREDEIARKLGVPVALAKELVESIIVRLDNLPPDIA